MCGNHWSSMCWTKPTEGSPPRVREPLCKCHNALDKRGITPACAGTTLPDNKLTSRYKGSPPRVREPLACCLFFSGKAGITPACAGTTISLAAWLLWYWDHPRVCGNHTMISATLKKQCGSPPRVREPLLFYFDKSPLLRITPACAGTTIKLCNFFFEKGDHPRVCGNHPND